MYSCCVVVGRVCESILVGVFVHYNIVRCWSSNLYVILWYLHILKDCCECIFGQMGRHYDFDGVYIKFVWQEVQYMVTY